MFYIPDSFLEGVLQEDIPYGDATVTLFGLKKEKGLIECAPKADTIVCGASPSERLFRMAGLETELLCEDGDRVPAGTCVLRARGAAEAIHAVYKTAQNIMEYCSGIASRARAMADEAEAGRAGCRVVTTRKHFPGTKILSLYAATAGGALVHRMGLSESILVFDQHRVFMPDFLERLRAAKALEPERKIAVEAGTPEEARAFAEAGADIIQCERMPPEDFRTFAGSVKSAVPGILLSATGGVRADNARAYAAAGADFLVTSWPYFGKPADIKMKISAG